MRGIRHPGSPHLYRKHPPRARCRSRWLTSGAVSGPCCPAPATCQDLQLQCSSMVPVLTAHHSYTKHTHTQPSPAQYSHLAHRSGRERCGGCDVVIKSNRGAWCVSHVPKTLQQAAIGVGKDAQVRDLCNLHDKQTGTSNRAAVQRALLRQ